MSETREQGVRSRESGQLSRLPILGATLFATIPIILFYTILFRTSVNLPFIDDYDAVLNFMNELTRLGSPSAKVSYYLSSQHNEYKLFFEHAILWLQFTLLGHIDFKMLCAIGNGFILLLALLLWKMFLPNREDYASRLALFIPASWLLFQLQYFETLNWAMGGLQNLPILVFSFASIYFLVRTTRRAFSAALVFFILAVASSGNGFLLIPIGLLVLFVGRRFAQAAIWILASAACIAAYSYHYNAMASQTDPHRSVFATLLHLNPLYAIGFMGNAAGMPFRNASFVLGALLCFFFLWMAFRGYVRRNPLISYCVLFLLLTAAGVAGIRSGFGAGQSLDSRYCIYSALLLIFTWFILVEEFFQNSPGSLLNNGAYMSAVAITILFSLLMDGVGGIQIQFRDSSLIQAMYAFEHSGSPGSNPGPSIQAPEEPAGHPVFSPRARMILINFNVRARQVLVESMKLGVYQPPPY